ncbi:MAG TPA: TolC family protein, partial [Flavobacteriaceae bacterium]|nr:TolC family protein [Flavobacteriaceae bacterium]
FLSTLNDNLVQVEQKSHPLLEAKKQEKERLEIQEKNITHQVLPNISLLAGGMFRGVGFSDQGSQWKDSYELPINNYLVGVGMTWDISSFYDHGVKKRLNQQEQIRIKEEETAVERHLEERENSLLYHIDKSLEEIEDAEEAYAAASESYRLFKVRYESGIIDLATLLQIQQTLQFTEKSRLKAYYDYWNYWNAYAYSQADFSVLTTVFN